MNEVLFRRTITTLDLADGKLELEPDDEKALKERFGFSAKATIPVSMVGDEISESHIEEGFLVCPAMRERDDLVFQSVEFTYYDGVLLARLQDDPEQEAMVDLVKFWKDQRDSKTTRLHIQVQSALAVIGERLGYSIWISEGDRRRVAENLPKPLRLLAELPRLTINDRANSIARLIDVVFVPQEPHQLPQLYEVESTTPIYSGLLRLNDFYSWRKDAGLHIVTHRTRIPKFKRELSRPSFFVIQSVVRLLTFDEVRDWRTKLEQEIQRQGT